MCIPSHRQIIKVIDTGKYLIGITPQETISKGSGGRASEQHITENSKYLKYVVYNVIMAYTGFNIAKTLGMLGINLEISSFTKSQDQLRAADIKDTHAVSNVKINAEQVIGNLRKKYSILMELCQ